MTLYVAPQECSSLSHTLTPFIVQQTACMKSSAMDKELRPILLHGFTAFFWWSNNEIKQVLFYFRVFMHTELVGPPKKPVVPLSTDSYTHLNVSV